MGFAKAAESRCAGNLGLCSLWAMWMVGLGDFVVPWSEQHSYEPAEVFVNLSVQRNYFHGALFFRGTELVPRCELGLGAPV